MRITNNIITQSALSHVQGNLRQIHRAQEQVSTGLKLRKASDDPIAASTSMETRGSLRALEQYRRGIQTATARTGVEESVLDQLSEILIRAKELGIVYGSDTATANERSIAQRELEQLFEHAVGLANTRFQEAYLFGGNTATQRPYEIVGEPGSLDFTTSSPTGGHLVEISSSQLVPANHSGSEVFEETGVLAVLRDMAQALGAGDRDAIVATLHDVDTAFDRVQHLLGEVGARTNSLQVTRANLDAVEINLLTLKSEAEEVDLERAITELMSRQTTYQAALMATSQVMGLTLADYLR